MKALNSYKIQHRKDGRYAVKVGNRGTVIQLYAKTKQQLKEKLADVLKQIEEARLYELENQTRSTTRLKDWARCCLENYSKPHVTGNTYASYLNILHHHLGELGEKPIGGISCIMIQQHLLGLKKVKSDKPLSPKMLLNIRNFLSMVFRLAIQNRILLRNPVDGVILPKGAVRKPRALTRDEQATLIRVVRKSKRLLMFAVILALYTGMRKGELLALKWEDIEDSAIHVKRSTAMVAHIDKNGKREWKREVWDTKTENSVRTIPILETTQRMLADYRLAQSKLFRAHGLPPSEYVFTTDSGDFIGSAQLTASYGRLLARAGVKYRKFHAIRHTFATEAIRRGVAVKDLQQIMGHSNIKTTYMYVHSDDESKRAAIERMGEIM